MTNAESVALGDVPVLDFESLRNFLVGETRGGGRLATLCGMPGQAGPHGGLRILAVVARDGAGILRPVLSEVGPRYPALTPDLPQAHLFEREMAERFGVEPVGHPRPRPVRYTVPGSLGPKAPAKPRPLPADTDFFRMSGEEVHEVAVGPIHAGIIEPGHFRFQCHGETVFHLEIALGYQHRGIEAALTGPLSRGGRGFGRIPHFMATAAGDTTVGHTLAWCGTVESLTRTGVPERAAAFRLIALELERLANHTGDLGALAGDVAYLPTMSFCGRLRGDFLNMTALLCGNRFGRGLVVPGGVGFDADGARLAELRGRFESTMRDVEGAADLLFETPSVRARFEHTGAITRETATALGLVGPATRACGLARDVRVDHPFGAYGRIRARASTWPSGDVFARANVRRLEIRESARLIRTGLDALSTLPEGGIAADGPPWPRPMPPDSLTVSLVEAWRGEICHVAATGPDGRLSFYKMTDPSFHNWEGLAMALRGVAVSDFPLCNKSFNLSYCGHDL
ncbi:hydrogenase large subunit [Desulfolutivibrio sulfoxidireducens]|nr:NADH-quinone oxidoreductase subunit C [Desulfolutivibrio sulfoxidireducens]QLA17578.1 hydrogenase [Desulfolutivibrio sulfoxidireducens]QLA21156.1 hydrogenase [Desulfolutivibrio sulfoxidireducens]